MSEILVRQATEQDIPPIARVLAQAFDEEPFVNWFVLPDEKRADRIHWFFEGYLRHVAMPYGLVYTTTERNGAILWCPPGKWKLSLARQLVLLPVIARITGFRRLASRLIGANAAQRRHPRQPHYYLQAIGVEPSGQGHGIGSALLQPVLQICDQERKGAYLETAGEENVAFYERHGFRVTEKIRLPHGGPQIWLMWRDPA